MSALLLVLLSLFGGLLVLGQKVFRNNKLYVSFLVNLYSIEARLDKLQKAIFFDSLIRSFIQGYLNSAVSTTISIANLA